MLNIFECQSKYFALFMSLKLSNALLEALPRESFIEFDLFWLGGCLGGMRLQR